MIFLFYANYIQNKDDFILFSNDNALILSANCIVEYKAFLFYY